MALYPYSDVIAHTDVDDELDRDELTEEEALDAARDEIGSTPYSIAAWLGDSTGDLADKPRSVAAIRAWADQGEDLDLGCTLVMLMQCHEREAWSVVMRLRELFEADAMIQEIVRDRASELLAQQEADAEKLEQQHQDMMDSYK